MWCALQNKFADTSNKEGNLQIREFHNLRSTSNEKTSDDDPSVNQWVGWLPEALPDGLTFGGLRFIFIFSQSASGWALYFVSGADFVWNFVFAHDADPARPAQSADRKRATKKGGEGREKQARSTGLLKP